MGLKYYELIKSIVLTFLVLLSIALTFSIWNYTPNLQIIDEKPIGQTMIGEEKRLKDVIKPYRILFHESDQFHGTIASIEIDKIIGNIKQWEFSKFTLENSNLSKEKINDFLRGEKRLTLFFESEIPLNMIDSSLFYSENGLPEIMFNRMIIDWSKLSPNNTITIYFVSTSRGAVYNTVIEMDEEEFQPIIEDHHNLVEFMEVERNNELSLYVPKENLDFLKLTYYIDEISPEKFKDILFIEPSIVRRTFESDTLEKYIDGMTLMTVDTKSKAVNYVNPASESVSDIPPSKLLQDSFEFINEHGGFTGDYRYKSMNANKHIIDYQLYMQGLPVLSDDTSTRITTTWGDNQIFRYKRPYYRLDMNISSEKDTITLPSGIEIVEKINNSPNVQLEEIEDLYIGYYLTQSDNELLYMLKPCWFANIDGTWKQLTPERLGGVDYGLE